MPESSRYLTRRSVVGTALWAVPVIAVATAAPAFASSRTNDLGIWMNGIVTYDQTGRPVVRIYVDLSPTGEMSEATNPAVQFALTLNGVWGDEATLTFSEHQDDDDAWSVVGDSEDAGHASRTVTLTHGGGVAVGGMSSFAVEITSGTDMDAIPSGIAILSMITSLETPWTGSASLSTTVDLSLD